MRLRLGIPMGFALGLLVISAAGAAALAQLRWQGLGERDRSYFQGRLWCECGFDSLSAACGAGLMMGELSAYSPDARWVLFGIGFAGALLHVVTIAAVIRRIVGLPAPRQADAPEREETAGAAADPSGSAGHLAFAESSFAAPASAASADYTEGPTLPFIALSFCFVLALLIALVYAAARAACPTVTFAETAQLVGLAFISLGCVPQPVDPGTALLLAVVGWIGALGWPVWLGLIPRQRRGFDLPAPALRFALIYTLALVAAGGGLTLLERPRGGEAMGVNRVETRSDLTLAAQPPGPRFGRSLVQATAAATCGIATEPVGDRGLRDGSEALLALLVIFGGAGFGAAGGIGLLSFWLAFFGRGERTRRLGLLCILSIAGLTLLTALGLLSIESLIASRYQPTPTFADALLDAASAVGGANVSSGLTANLTSRSLVSGIGLGVSQYIPAMALLGLALLAGRIVPIALLARMSRR